MSTAAIRRVCEAGVIQARKSEGGHYHIDTAELDRLKKLDGLPPAPRAAVAPLESKKLRPTARTGTARTGNSGLLADPSHEAVEAAELALISDRHVASSRNQLEILRMRREVAELTDFFEDQERRRQADEWEQRRRAAEETAERQAEITGRHRREFNEEWLTYALNKMPYNAPPQLAAEIRREVLATLADIEPPEPPKPPSDGGQVEVLAWLVERVAIVSLGTDRTRNLVDAAVARARHRAGSNDLT